jgi:hypothetical protein
MKKRGVALFPNKKAAETNYKFVALFPNKKAAMEISFGMIFSIILIIVFLSFAFFGIKKLLGVQEVAMIEQFKDNFQNDVNKIWNGPQGQQTVEYNLPRKVEGVCIENSEFQNVYFLPEGKFARATINNIDMEKSIVSNNRLCFEKKEGKIVMTLGKDFGENKVTVSR